MGRPSLAEASRIASRLGFIGTGIMGNCSRNGAAVSGRLFGECRNAGRMCCMDRARNNHRRAGWLSLLVLCAVCGCQTVRTPEEKIASGNIPREFQKVSMPDYVLEPPDLLIVEVLDALPGRPISGERLVRPDGKISLGFYGEVYVAGLTMPEVKEKLVLHLRKYLTDIALGLVVIDETGNPEIDPKTNKPKMIE